MNTETTHTEPSKYVALPLIARAMVTHALGAPLRGWDANKPSMRWATSGVYVSAHDRTLTLLATDGRRLAVYTRTGAADAAELPPLDLLVPLAAWRDLKVGRNCGRIDLAVNCATATLTAGQNTTTFTPTTRTPPPLDAVMPEPAAPGRNIAYFQPRHMADAFALLARFEAGAVKVHLTEKGRACRFDACRPGDEALTVVVMPLSDPK
jgi:hypothetical protein